MVDTIEFRVTGETTLHCAGCEQRVANALRRLAGVQEVRASAHTQQVVVTLDSDQVTPDQMQAKLEQLGYQVALQRDSKMSTPITDARTDSAGQGPAALAVRERARTNGTAKLQLKIGGMHCSLCTESI